MESFQILIGAGYACKKIGKAVAVVFGGLLVATFLSTLVVPVFYVVMKSLLGEADAKPAVEASAEAS